jgi:hypothetical protein
MRPRSHGASVEVGLHVPDDVLLDEVAQEALVHAVHDRRGRAAALARERCHLLAHLDPGTPCA